MAQSHTKTTPGLADVSAFLDAVPDSKRRMDALALLPVFERATGWPACMWGSNMVGFGRYQYRYTSGREAEWFVAGFSPRKGAMSVYIMPGFDKMSAEIARLGTFKFGKSCINIKKLEDVDLDVLGKIIRLGLAEMQSEYTVVDV